MNSLQKTKEGEVIVHRPLISIPVVELFYSEKDGVPVRYVCTTELVGDFPVDIFHRGTPHPEYGNSYFGLYQVPSTGLMITNADIVEDLDFEMIKDAKGYWHYSRYRHDCHQVGGTAIDGGRSYTRLVGNDFATEPQKFKVKDGDFYLG